MLLYVYLSLLDNAWPKLVDVRRRRRILRPTSAVGTISLEHEDMSLSHPLSTSQYGWDVPSAIPDSC